MSTTEDTYTSDELPVALGSGRDGSGFRTYEVYKRQRVRDATPLIKPRQLTSVEYLQDPYPIVGILRENYPCYRDWPGNCFWITRYDDVTSVFTDDANYETRSKRWFYGMPGFGRDLRGELPVLTCVARTFDANAAGLAEQILGEITALGRATDLATEFAARYAMELLARLLNLPAGDLAVFVERYWRMQRGYHWEPRAEQAGKEAIAELVAYFEPLLVQRRSDPGDDLVSVIATLDGLDGGPTTAADLVATLLEDDHETLHGALANLWFLLLTHPDQLAVVSDERRLMRFAYQETLRHSTPVVATRRFAKHEVERFGRLLPDGAMMLLSAAAANRDPRQYDEPDRFIVGRKDLCPREPRGSFRADGLPAGIAFGLGQPSKYPAVPEDRPRSRYAIVRDTVVTASSTLLDQWPSISLAAGATPSLRSLRWGEMHASWSLPVTF